MNLNLFLYFSIVNNNKILILLNIKNKEYKEFYKLFIFYI